MATAGTSFPVTITIKDAYGNGYSGPVSLTASDGEAVSPAAFAMVHGSATLALALRTAGTVTLTATAGTVKGSSAITVNPGAAVTYRVSPPTWETAGSAFDVLVAAKDSFGNAVPSANGSVTLYSGDGQKVQGASVTLNNGVGTAQVTLDVADTLTLTAVGGGLSGVSGWTTVAPGVPSIVQVFAPTAVTAGVPFNFTATARDAFGNGCTGLASLSMSDGQGGTPTWVSLVKGAGTAWAALDKADSLTLKANLNGVVGSSNSFTVFPAALASFVVSSPSSATVGTSFTVNVTAKDAYGNTETGFTAPAALYCSDGQTITPGVVSLTNGVGSAQITLNKADTVGLAVGYNGILGFSGSILVSGGSLPGNPASAVTYCVSPPATETAGSAVSFTVMAKDASGNTVTSDNGSVTLFSSDGQKVQGASVTLTNGVGTAHITLDVADSITLTAIGGGLSGVSGWTSVLPAAPSIVQVFAPTAVTAGVPFNFTVTAKDAFGNGCTGLASLSTSDGQGGTPTWVSLVKGAGTAWVTLDKADSLTLKAKLNGVVGSSNSFTVFPAALASFLVSAPGSATTGTSFTINVTAKDAYGNTETGFTAPAVLYCSDGQTITPNVVSLINGVRSAQIALKKADTVGLTVDYNGILGFSGSILVGP